MYYGRLVPSYARLYASNGYQTVYVYQLVKEHGKSLPNAFLELSVISPRSARILSRRTLSAFSLSLYTLAA